MRQSHAVRQALKEERRVWTQTGALVRVLHRPFAHPKRAWIAVPSYGRPKQKFLGATPSEAANGFVLWCSAHPELAQVHRPPPFEPVQSGSRASVVPPSDPSPPPATGPSVASSPYSPVSSPPGYTEDAVEVTYTVRRRRRVAPSPAQEPPEAPLEERIIDLLAEQESGLSTPEIAQRLAASVRHVTRALEDHREFGAVYVEHERDGTPRWHLG